MSKQQSQDAPLHPRGGILGQKDIETLVGEQVGEPVAGAVAGAIQEGVVGVETPESLAEVAASTTLPAQPEPPARDDQGEPPSPKETSDSYKALVNKARRLAADLIVSALEQKERCDETGKVIQIGKDMLLAKSAMELLKGLQEIISVEEWTKKLEKAILERPDRLGAGPTLPPLLAKVAGFATRTRKAQKGDGREGKNKPTGTEGAGPQDD